MLSLLYGYRAVTMMVTVLPKVDPVYYCTPKLAAHHKKLSLGTVFGRVFRLLSGEC